ncbi:exopolysaccharide biosynthesis polyprenyl glycosylphosphotransferase [Ochrobactrum sp. A-1]|uniref:exopolysaccharide biosynthesis polyprenyl glycosylphosphotransferase n=1 Tax=Ochrobactrum sp. A-1 TaxID=2920940 RepID=UPI001F0B5B0E|nr:exopolysaccharide biosynthesis polyprenyl glycosylphosphotransferase [Ochrobactrum sp. A-1]
MRMGFNPNVVFSINHQVTVTAAIVAHVMGYMLYRRLETFPGMTAYSNILPTFAFTYGLVFVTIFFFRLDYSRFQAFGSFFMSISWYFGINMFVRRREPYRLAVIPGGGADRLQSVRGVVWQVLPSPTAAVGRVQGVVADLRADLSDSWDRFITSCVLTGTPVYHVKQVLESLTGRVDIEHISENTLGSLNPNQAYLQIKQIVDWLAALFVLVIASPAFLIVATAIRLETPGPALFRQERIGYRGKRFLVYKFRTMRCIDGTPEDKESAITRVRDPRITRLGHFLRRTRIDELPQLINVLRGEMSWIGPRPEAVVLAQWYDAELPFYPYRHIVRPGITGWAQVNQGHVAAVNEVHEKLHYDFYYIKNISPWLDLVIVMRTVRIMFTGFGAK